MTIAAIQFIRINRPSVVYRERLVFDDGRCLHTANAVTAAERGPWSAHWWAQGLVSRGRIVGFVRKWHFYTQWFGIMELSDVDGAVLGYYCDVLTPLEKTPAGYRLRDLLLDVWIGADGHSRVLDEDEFAAAVQAGALTPDVQAKAEATVTWILGEQIAGRFPLPYLTTPDRLEPA